MSDNGLAYRQREIRKLLAEARGETILQDLYFIANPATSMVKIGVSHNVVSRCETLTLAAGVKMEIISVLPERSDLESPLHAAFFESRGIGEWFRRTAELSALAALPARVDEWLAAHEDEVAAGYAHVAEQKAARLEAQRQHRGRQRAVDGGIDRRRLAQETGALYERLLESASDRTRLMAETYAEAYGIVLGDRARVDAFMETLPDNPTADVCRERLGVLKRELLVTA